MAMPCMPTPRRAAFIMPNIAGMPLFELADQEALGAVEIEHAGRLRLDAHLLLDAAAADAVARAHLAVRLRQELRHQEQRDVLGAARRIRQARITRWMMLSVRSWSPPEMKILVPVIE